MLCLRSASYGPLDIVGLLNPVLGFKGGESNVYAPLSLMCGSGRMGKEGANRPRQQMKLWISPPFCRLIAYSVSHMLSCMPAASNPPAEILRASDNAIARDRCRKRLPRILVWCFTDWIIGNGDAHCLQLQWGARVFPPSLTRKAAVTSVLKQQIT